MVRIALLSLLSFTCLPALSTVDRSYDPLRIEKRILSLSLRLDVQMMELSNYESLKAFCSDYSYRERIFGLLDEIHRYHDLLENELQNTSYTHSRKTISRILKHMDHLDRKFNPDAFAGFFREQCGFQQRIEKYSDHYKAGFSTHSYGGQVYAQEVVMYRYVKRLTRRVARIRRHVVHFYIRRKVWEH